MTFLFIGDIVGAAGRAAVQILAPKLRKKYQPDLVIANVENLAHGKGVTETTLAEMRTAGIDYCTGGNHIFAKKGYETALAGPDARVLRPANYPPQTPGSGEKLINISQKNILLINLMGRVFFREHLDCPFRTFDAILKKYEKQDITAVIVDFHAEATSEKNAFRFYADGRAAAIIGTHTHVPTADEHVSKQGTAYITDVGGVFITDSVLGVDKNIIIQNFISQIPAVHELPIAGVAEFNAVLVSTDNHTGKATNIQRIRKTVATA